MCENWFLSMEQKSISKNLFWKLLERFGVQGIQFVLQIVLARILSPDHYGTLSLMIIFTTLANVFIQTGFNTALIQNKDVTEDDYSSVFWVTMIAALGLYAILYFTAPIIGDIYNMPEIAIPFRVLALMLIPGGFNSIQLAKISREFNFRKVFFSNVGAIIVSGITGIVIAYNGGGLWALVVQYLTNTTLACIIMFFTVKWRPKAICDFKRVKILFSYGWKLLVSSLLDTLYQDLRSLVIGIKYKSETLGFYNRGKHFPQFIMNAVNGAVQSVMLPAMSSEQDDKKMVKGMVRRSVMLSAFVIFPFMAGLAATAPSLINILLTDKWMPCVPYMQIYCVTLAFYPIHSCNLQAINAIGRSDIFLVLEIIKKGIGVGTLVLAVFCFDSPIVIALTGIFTTVISFFINAYPNKKLINYSYFEQAKDLAPQLILAFLMFGIVYSVNFIKLNVWITLCVQILLGICLYVGLSALFKIESYQQTIQILKKFLSRKKVNQ